MLEVPSIQVLTEGRLTLHYVQCTLNSTLLLNGLYADLQNLDRKKL